MLAPCWSVGSKSSTSADERVSRKSYLLSLPERIARSVLGLGAGAAREVGQVVLPGEIRKSRLYKNVVDGMLRFVIEKVGGAEGVYGADEALPEDFVARRTAGNVVEVVGIVAFRASPVWVLAALSDVAGMGRHLIPEIAGALQEQGLLEADAEFASVDQVLDGLERTSARLAATVNTPPLHVAELRKEWAAIQEDARRMRPGSLPTRETLAGLWSELKSESVRQKKSIFETSSLVALSAARSLPGGVRWLSAGARVGAVRAGQVFAAVLLDHYRESLRELRQTGYVSYARRQLAP